MHLLDALAFSLIFLRTVAEPIVRVHVDSAGNTVQEEARETSRLATSRKHEQITSRLSITRDRRHVPTDAEQDTADVAGSRRAGQGQSALQTQRRKNELVPCADIFAECMTGTPGQFRLTRGEVEDHVPGPCGVGPVCDHLGRNEGEESDWALCGECCVDCPPRETDCMQEIIDVGCLYSVPAGFYRFAASDPDAAKHGMCGEGQACDKMGNMAVRMVNDTIWQCRSCTEAKMARDGDASSGTDAAVPVQDGDARSGTDAAVQVEAARAQSSGLATEEDSAAPVSEATTTRDGTARSRAGTYQYSAAAVIVAVRTFWALL
eukprot:gb/GFBE01012573.1/.p1 GENE.gb/GFBE01012573.1/~~gb/GFBE01012573.1/.p1  ORF type:complete len:320 (+),score=30.07 gb/GFBE01012573.1/:1-960(+)